MRIIAGTARGHRLLAPKSGAIRPTADRVRETIFNILGQSLDSQAILDLFAGTGALGLEALSRGADSAVLIDSHRDAARLCQVNAQLLGFARRVRVLSMPVARGLRLLARENAKFDLIFADPPYASKAAADTVAAVEAAELLNPGGILCVEHDKREPAPDAVMRLTRFDQRRFGDTAVSLYRVA
jgi:16S rRNA (guanine(966)-N(2))-methyltransferase RsmD